VPSRSDGRGEQRLDGDVHLKGRPRRPLLRNVRVSYSNNRRYRSVAAFTRRDANAKCLSERRVGTNASRFQVLILAIRGKTSMQRVRNAQQGGFDRPGRGAGPLCGPTRQQRLLMGLEPGMWHGFLNISNTPVMGTGDTSAVDARK